MTILLSDTSRWTTETYTATLVVLRLLINTFAGPILLGLSLQQFVMVHGQANKLADSNTLLYKKWDLHVRAAVIGSATTLAVSGIWFLYGATGQARQFRALFMHTRINVHGWTYGVQGLRSLLPGDDLFEITLFATLQVATGAVVDRLWMVLAESVVRTGVLNDVEPIRFTPDDCFSTEVTEGLVLTLVITLSSPLIYIATLLLIVVWRMHNVQLSVFVSGSFLWLPTAASVWRLYPRPWNSVLLLLQTASCVWFLVAIYLQLTRGWSLAPHFSSKGPSTSITKVKTLRALWHVLGLTLILALNIVRMSGGEAQLKLTEKAARLC